MDGYDIYHRRDTGHFFWHRYTKNYPAELIYEDLELEDDSEASALCHEMERLEWRLYILVMKSRRSEGLQNL